ncbi:MAG: sulfite exporter TauE/SafE family protein [bacterium]
MEKIFYASGMHCASCELIIHKEISQLSGVKKVMVSAVDNSVKIEVTDDKVVSVALLNKKFKELGYHFSHQPNKGSDSLTTWILAVAVSVVFLVIFFLFGKLGLSSWILVGAESSLIAFFVFGLIAGSSSCAALVGGIVLSLSKNWLGTKDQAISGKILPHLVFNLGRLLSFAILGAILGAIGSKALLSPTVHNVMIALVSLYMVISGLKLMGISLGGRWFSLSSKKVTKKLADLDENKTMSPFVIGLLTVLLPCGFTLVTESVAMISGSWFTGMMIMVMFVFGTAIPLLLIGFFSVKLMSGHFARLFTKIAGILIIVFALYNLTIQFNLDDFLAVKPVSDTVKTETINARTINMVYTSQQDISPNTIEVKVGEKIHLVLDVKDTAYGCMSTIMIQELFETPQRLRAGSQIIMDFTATKAGSYLITCAMGVPRGTVKVVE